MRLVPYVIDNICFIDSQPSILKYVYGVSDINNVEEVIFEEDEENFKILKEYFAANDPEEDMDTESEINEHPHFLIPKTKTLLLKDSKDFMCFYFGITDDFFKIVFYNSSETREQILTSDYEQVESKFPVYDITRTHLSILMPKEAVDAILQFKNLPSPNFLMHFLYKENEENTTNPVVVYFRFLNHSQLRDETLCTFYYEDCLVYSDKKGTSFDPIKVSILIHQFDVQYNPLILHRYRKLFGMFRRGNIEDIVKTYGFTKESFLYQADSLFESMHNFETLYNNRFTKPLLFKYENITTRNFSCSIKTEYREDSDVKGMEKLRLMLGHLSNYYTEVGIYKVNQMLVRPGDVFHMYFSSPSVPASVFYTWFFPMCVRHRASPETTLEAYIFSFGGYSETSNNNFFDALFELLLRANHQNLYIARFSNTESIDSLSAYKISMEIEGLVVFVKLDPKNDMTAIRALIIPYTNLFDSDACRSLFHDLFSSVMMFKCGICGLISTGPCKIDNPMESTFYNTRAIPKIKRVEISKSFENSDAYSRDIKTYHYEKHLPKIGKDLLSFFSYSLIIFSFNPGEGGMKNIIERLLILDTPAL